MADPIKQSMPPMVVLGSVPRPPTVSAPEYPTAERAASEEPALWARSWNALKSSAFKFAANYAVGAGLGPLARNIDGSESKEAAEVVEQVTDVVTGLTTAGVSSLTEKEKNSKDREFAMLVGGSLAAAWQMGKKMAGGGAVVPLAGVSGFLEGKETVEAALKLRHEISERGGRLWRGDGSAKQRSSDIVRLMGMGVGATEAVLMSRIPADRFFGLLHVKNPISSAFTFAQNTADALGDLSDWQWERTRKLDLGGDWFGRNTAMKANPTHRRSRPDPNYDIHAHAGPVPWRLPGYDRGGMTTRDHIAVVHKDEGIIPIRQVPEIFAKTLEKSNSAGRARAGQPVVVNLTVNVNGTGEVDEFRQKVVPLLRSEIVSLFEEMSLSLSGVA